MDVAFERGRTDFEIELPVQFRDEPVEQMNRALIGLVHQRIRAGNQANPPIIEAERRNIGIVQPKVRTMGADIRQKSAWVANVQVAHCRGQDEDVPR